MRQAIAVAIPAAAPASKKVVIRAPKRSELERLLVIERRCFRTHRFTKETFEYHFGNPSSIFSVAESSGKIVGYIAGIIYHGSSRKVAKIYSMAVMPKSRRLGAGSMLLRYFEQEAVKRGCRWATLEVRKSNRSARLLYRRFGYETEEVLKDYYAHGSDGLRMRKTLRF
jgi:[ribosomal protein S18]-alanine N-acetyltransferase